MASPFSWRWAESNRRPNNVPSSFLHAYPSFGCRPRPAGRRASRGLSFESWPALKESAGASLLNDTLYSEHRRRKVRRILVRAAALAAGIKLIDLVD